MIVIFEVFTDDARKVITRSQELARARNHHYIGTEHVLLALVSYADNPANKAIVKTEAEARALEETIDETIGTGNVKPYGHIPFTPRAKVVFERAVRESRERDLSYVDSNSILLALLKEGEGVGAQILKNKGIEYQDVKDYVESRLRPDSRSSSISHTTKVDPMERIADALERIAKALEVE